MSALLPKQSVDRRLILAATKIGHTGQDLSDAVNGQMSPAQAVARVHELLNASTIYDEVQERRLLYIRMGKWLDDLQEKHGGNIKAAGAINKAFKLVSDQLERSQVNVQDISSKLSADHAQFFVTALIKASDIIIDRIQKQTGEVLEAEFIGELTQAGAEEAQAYMKTVTARPADD